MDFLKGYPLFKWSINMFNDTIGVIYTLLGVSPMDGTYKEAWNMVSNLYNVFLGIGAPLLTIFFVWGFCRDALDLKAELQFEATVNVQVHIYSYGNGNVCCMVSTFVPYGNGFVGTCKEKKT